MRKIFLIVVCVMLISVPLLWASKQKAAEGPKKPEDIVIRVVYLDVSINFAQPIKAGVEQAAKDFGVDAKIDGPVNWNIDQQVSIIEGYITQQIDGLAIAPLSAEVIDPIIAKALDAGIPVVTFNTDRTLLNPGGCRLGILLNIWGLRGKS
jgi:simple sugar transport system substrate-binding protein